MTSWNYYFIGRKNGKSECLYNKQLQIIRDYMEKREEKKMIGNTKFEFEAMPCVVKAMDDIEWAMSVPRYPAFSIEVQPKTAIQASQLFDYLHKGTKLNMSMECRGLFLEKDLNVARGSRFLISTLEPERIIHSGPATIVFWNDKTKTVVKCSKNDIYDEYEAFCAALAIKMFGSNSHLKKMIHDKTEDRTPKKEADVEIKCDDKSLQKAINNLKKAFGVEYQ